MLLSEQTVPDITAAQMLAMNEQEFLGLHAILKHMRPKYELESKTKKVGHIKATSLFDLTFSEVETVKLKASKGEFVDVIGALEIVFKRPIKELLQMKCYEFYTLYNWFMESLRGLIEREIKMFKDDTPDPKWEAAGGDRMTMFGSYNTTIPLAEKFGKTPAEIGAMRYIDVFSSKLYFKELMKIQKEYQDMIKREQKLKAKR